LADGYADPKGNLSARSCRDRRKGNPSSEGGKESVRFLHALIIPNNRAAALRAD
jgi:hypothetical protein